jgi:hypothetical protein
MTVCSCGAGVRRPEEATWVRRLSAERDNIVAAVDWAIHTGNVDSAARVVAPLEFHLHSHPQLGLADVPARVLALEGIEAHGLFTRVVGSAAWGLVLSGDSQAAVEVARAASEGVWHP